MGERCRTCGVADPKDCKMISEAGCDHPAVERENSEMMRALMAGELTSGGARDDIEALKARVRELEGILRLAGNRIERLLIEFPFTSRLRYEANGWVRETRDALARAAGIKTETGAKASSDLPSDQEP